MILEIFNFGGFYLQVGQFNLTINTQWLGKGYVTANWNNVCLLDY